MKLSRHMAPLLLATLVAVSAPVCAQTVPAPAPDTTASASNAGATPLAGDAVYKAFHGEEGIQRIMDDFIVRITTDPRIKDRFANANLARLKLLLVQQVSYLIGGPQTYTGRAMKTTHEGMGLQNGDFNALAEDLQLSMDKEGVPFRAQNKLLAKLAPMEHQIVPR